VSTIYSVLLTHCHPLSATHFFSLFIVLPFSPVLKKLSYPNLQEFISGRYIW